MRRKLISFLIPVVVLTFLGIGCRGESATSHTVDLSTIILPSGFEISIYADNVPNARSLALSPNGTLFVGTRQGDKVYALQDTDGDFVADLQYEIGEGLVMPNGVAFRDNSLFVAEVSRILRFDDIENHLLEPPDAVVIFDDFPSDRHHGWKYIAFGPDGMLYVPVGAPCNVCDRGDPYGTITRINPDGSGFELFARGIRNTVGFTWHPETGEMWFADNGRDNMGDDIPADELNYAPAAGMDFGFPHVHAGTILDPEFGQDFEIKGDSELEKSHSVAEFTRPAQLLGPHVAPLGIEFYTGENFPESYKNQLFIAEHGSWNRSVKTGYRISMVTIKSDQSTSDYTTFAEGWLQGEEAWGRPVDIELMLDGSILISDDLAGVIYRIHYTGK
jgi:glucose/arabinose dehydrogenase